MTFRINLHPTINEIAELAGFAKETPMAARVGALALYQFRLVEDRQRNAFMFETNAVSRDSCVQNHYLLYFMGHWFDIRSKNLLSLDVCFYDFPPSMEGERYWIKQCFAQAARICGRAWPHSDDASLFDPVFCEDDWYPGAI